LVFNSETPDGIIITQLPFFITSQNKPFAKLFIVIPSSNFNIFPFVIGPEESPKEHLKVLSGMARLLRNTETRSGIRAANTSEDLYSFLKTLLEDAINALEKLESDKYLSLVISDLKRQRTLCQEGMAKMLDTVYRAMQREQNKKAD